MEGWLSDQNTYTLHKPVRSRFPRSPYTVTNIDDVWEMDFGDLSSLSKYNVRYKYLLNVVDIFSRYVWSVPLKHKIGSSIKSALKVLFENRKPIKIQSDKGTEFVNATVQQYLKRKGVSFHTTRNPDIKGAIGERFYRNLKKKCINNSLSTTRNTYLEVINKLLASYNNSIHSKIGMPRAK